MGLSLVRLKRSLGLSTPGVPWRLLAIIFALLNLKNLPFVWHIRLFSALLQHILLRPPNHAPLTAPPRLFAPLITTSRSPLLECDYNLHKSNSTYFSDLDIARAHLVTSLCAPGMARVQKQMRATGEGEEEAGKFVVVMLGGVHCSFRREIKPYEGYDIWTRVLGWDRKWLYVMSHFVKKGVVEPKGYLLQQQQQEQQRQRQQRQQPWREGKRSDHGGDNGHNITAATTPTPPSSSSSPSPPQHPAIFASSIAKYVFKKGRRTIPPSRILEAANLLPPSPTPPALVPPSSAEQPPTPTPTSAAGILGVENAASLVDAALTANAAGDGVWDWAKVEEERVRGMGIAGLMAGLDEGLGAGFRGDGEEALGRYGW
ncbi:hypothetical protein MMC08_008025 [Hypocenomyce scalaris]|nr:hypothetical protein [Hypocenomyce scalaris]